VVARLRGLTREVVRDAAEPRRADDLELLLAGLRTAMAAVSSPAEPAPRSTDGSAAPGPERRRVRLTWRRRSPGQQKDAPLSRRAVLGVGRRKYDGTGG
jgi:hypothetical protein